MTDEQLDYLLREYFWNLRMAEIIAEIEREEAAGIAGPELPAELRDAGEVLRWRETNAGTRISHHKYRPFNKL